MCPPRRRDRCSARRGALAPRRRGTPPPRGDPAASAAPRARAGRGRSRPRPRGWTAGPPARRDRKSVVQGKSVSVRLDLGGRRIIKKKNKPKHIKYRKTNTK